MSDYIPPEVLDEILFRLPIKTLLRCTSVCKSWYSLITSPNFISTHLNRPINKNLILIKYFVGRAFKDQYTFRIDNESFDELGTLEFPLNGRFIYKGSCKGLICLAGGSYSDNIILWNPSIRKFVKLPLPKVTYKSSCHVAIGFGVNSASNDYKVVRLVYPTTRDPVYRLLPKPMIELFELSTGCWRSIDAVDFKYIIRYGSEEQTFLNDVVHWIGYEGEDLTKRIITFNCQNDAFGVLELPRMLDSYSELRTTIYKDLLSFVYYKCVDANRSCCIWAMMDYGSAESWMIQFRISLSGSIWSGPFGFRANGDALIAFENSLQTGFLVSLDPKSEKMKDLEIWGRSFTFVHTHMESLVLVRHLSSYDAGGAGERTINEE